ncbi:hypothetical protein GUITHDRAFT_117001 [Guillardia theta CCMP2712]|uniref:RAD51 interacting motif domain-containing protein n=1 Tax=Guillardia theta (strain CCMP2712) TaxID=905079 RepID=L1IM19_GUITC|nr:hypothetical protein GUITHDRAFT_117001 [Guillardia theta CCMP2712]EKX36835.1 hypothetical protein GUITHDRAFT_117001 [Guillardia theta CCMP2712]|eukprot:XP_005823815.1 hypothetical protein GUITHDRAFT_117001 [Guillardia theta CCMP2712]
MDANANSKRRKNLSLKKGCEGWEAGTSEASGSSYAEMISQRKSMSPRSSGNSPTTGSAKKRRSRAPSADTDLQKALELSRQEFERQQASQSEDKEAEDAGRTAAPNAACNKQVAAAGIDQPNHVADETGDTIPDSEEDESPVESDVHVANDALLKEPPAVRTSEHDVSNPKVAKRPRAKESIDESSEEDATEEEEEEEEEEASEDDYEMSSDEDLKSKKAQPKAKQQITRNVPKRNDAASRPRPGRPSSPVDTYSPQSVVQQSKPKAALCPPATSQYSGAVVASLPPKAGMMRNNMSSAVAGGGVRLLTNNAGVRRPGLSRSSKVLPLHARPHV